MRDVANLALDIGGDYLLVEAGAKIGSNIAVGLKSLVSSYAPSVASGGGAVVKIGVGSAVDDIAFSVGLSDEVVVSASKLGGKGLAAKGGTKLLTQFSSSTIDDAVGLVMRNSNDVRHIFAAKHNLGPLVNKLGGQENTIRAVLNAANGKLPASGVFNNIPVSIGGQTVFMRGSVVNGVPRIGTMFIP